MLAALYLGGYLWARSRHAIIHRQGHGGHRVATHFVVGSVCRYGDPVPDLLCRALDLAYSPLRYLELGGWYLTKPPGTPWPDHPG